MINIHRLVFDPAEADESSNVGSYLRSSDGTLLTHSTVGAKEALDVSIANLAELGVYAEDSAHASGDNGQLALVVRRDADTSLVGADGDYAPLQVDANGRLKVAASVATNFEKAEDSAHVSGDIGAFTLGVRSDAEAALAADGDYHPFLFNSTGRLKVDADISIVSGFEKAEDSAHVSGDIGGYVLSVRQDTLSASAADGDYQSFKTDALGRMYANNSHQTMTNAAVSITTTATDIAATDLANRKRILVQNVSGAKIYLGKDATVTTSNGIELPAGGSIELDIGPGINLHGIALSGTREVRVMELA